MAEQDNIIDPYADPNPLYDPYAEAVAMDDLGEPVGWSDIVASWNAPEDQTLDPYAPAPVPGSDEAPMQMDPMQVSPAEITMDPMQVGTAAEAPAQPVFEGTEAGRRFDPRIESYPWEEGTDKQPLEMPAEYVGTEPAVPAAPEQISFLEGATASEGDPFALKEGDYSDDPLLQGFAADASQARTEERDLHQALTDPEAYAVRTLQEQDENARKAADYRQKREEALDQQRREAFEDWKEALRLRQQKMAEIDADLKRLSEKEIDPDRWWNSRDTGQKLAAIISAMIGGFMSPYNGGRNDALQMLRAEVESDRKMQAEDLDRQLRGVGQRRAALESEYATHGDLLRAEMYEVNASYQLIDQQVADYERNLDPQGTARRRATALRVGLRQKAAADYAAAEKAYMDQQLRYLKEARENAKTAAEIRKLDAETAKLRGQAGAGGSGGAAGMKGFSSDTPVRIYDAGAGGYVTRSLTPDERTRVIMIPTAQGKEAVIAATDAQVKEIEPVLNAGETMAQLGNEIAEGRRNTGWNTLPTEDKRRQVARWVYLRNEARGLLGMKQATKDENTMISEALSNPNEFFAQSQAELDEMNRFAETKLNVMLSRVPGYRGGLKLPVAKEAGRDDYNTRVKRLMSPMTPGGETESTEYVNVGTKRKPKMVERKHKGSMPDTAKPAGAMAGDVDDYLQSEVFRGKTPEQRVEFVNQTIVPNMKKELEKMIQQHTKLREGLPADHTKDTPEQRAKRDQSNHLAAGIQNYAGEIRRIKDKTTHDLERKKENEQILHEGGGIGLPEGAGGL